MLTWTCLFIIINKTLKNNTLLLYSPGLEKFSKVYMSLKIRGDFHSLCTFLLFPKGLRSQNQSPSILGKMNIWDHYFFWSQYWCRPQNSLLWPFPHTLMHSSANSCNPIPPLWESCFHGAGAMQTRLRRAADSTSTWAQGARDAPDVSVKETGTGNVHTDSCPIVNHAFPLKDKHLHTVTFISPWNNFLFQILQSLTEFGGVILPSDLKSSELQVKPS